MKKQRHTGSGVGSRIKPTQYKNHVHVMNSVIRRNYQPLYFKHKNAVKNIINIITPQQNLIFAEVRTTIKQYNNLTRISLYIDKILFKQWILNHNTHIIKEVFNSL